MPDPVMFADRLKDLGEPLLFSGFDPLYACVARTLRRGLWCRSSEGNYLMSYMHGAHRGR